VAERLAALPGGVDVEIVTITTEGDRSSAAPLGPGIFVKEIEEALRRGAIDAAVHSLKDLPAVVATDLALAAILPRHDPRDALVSRKARRIADLPQGALVATGSPRRRAQILHARPDLHAVDVRGNVDTRVRKLDEGRFDALVLAVAGLARLGIADAPSAPIPTDLCLPAPGQGAIVVETRAAGAAVRDLVARLDDAGTRACVTAERAFLAALGAGCMAPAAALATIEARALVLDAMVADPDGRRMRRERATGPASEAAGLGDAIGQRLRETTG
jgi:hydroxymethylbilane synthase